MSNSDLDLTDEEDEEEDLFAIATAQVMRKSNIYSANDLLEFYAYYKQVTEGRCQHARPPILQMKARSKWNAWHDLGDMTRTDARRAYINKLSKLEPKWLDETKSERQSSNHGHGVGQWVVHSIEAMPAEELKPDNEKTMFDYVKENNLERLREQLKPDDLLLQDEHGMSLIHWATDRNAVNILEYLVVRGANVNQRDAEQQTPLHYAASCGHVEAVRYLLALNADMALCDAEGQTCLDVADDEKICGLLKDEKKLRKASGATS
ncbi:uncharacterized protein Dwil_GK16311 [Drosophila willistoni]|uniref:Acyl-CoA-binding domain-containing protein 6 n=1 Tax=Drosophila willistoni TaxID=7260 RepID=B4N1I0_DROWI|nr:acyl-CoA-binding domain-containing protein 6 [Drosophila willistoni]EDW78219.1 uncharacterized protein Dwil_GK16311 [Drosophila willistoni]